MAMRSAVLVGLAAFAIACSSVGYRHATTSVLNDEPGKVGKKLGARVTRVYESSDGTQRIVEIEMPVDPDDVVGVEIIESDSSQRANVDRVTVIKDYDQNKTGVRLFTSQDGGLDFRVRLITFEEDL